MTSHIDPAAPRRIDVRGTVLPAYRAWQQTEDVVEAEISAEDMMLAKHWVAAATP